MSPGEVDRSGGTADETVHPEAAPGWLASLVQAAAAGPIGGAARARRARRGEGGRTRGGAGAASTSASRGSAVLIALRGASARGAEVLLTHRSPTMRSHAGQIAFPGGHIEQGDAGPVAAAVREAHEETGLDRDAVTPLALLSAVAVRRSGRPVHPVLAHWHSPAPVWPASPAETDDVFAAPLTELADPACRLTVCHGVYRGPAFRFNGYLVWGFTAAVLDGLIAAGGWHRPWRRGPARRLREELAASRNGEPERHGPAAGGRREIHPVAPGVAGRPGGVQCSESCAP